MWTFPRTPWNGSSRLQDARAAAGWDIGEWPANALRKTFISCHYESYGSIDETAKQAGTSVAMVHAHNRKLIKKREAEKLWTIRPHGGPVNLVPMPAPEDAPLVEAKPTPRKAR